MDTLKVRIFIDFDGTITLRDVGDALFERFGGAPSLQAIDSYRKNLISAVECFKRETSACGTVNRAALENFLDAQEIDPTFPAFIQFCHFRGLDVVIVSDGMDYYIDRILRKHSLAHVPYRANHLELIPVASSTTVTFEPSFPYTDEVCDRCACCKRNHMLNLSGEDDIIVYIGEGYSDRCPARYADIVFAKEELLTYCQQENISFYEYRSFGDITSRLGSMLDSAGKGRSKALRKRRHAELARREVFLGG